MRAVRFVIPKTGGNSFRVQTERSPHFYDTIHYHPEHQITVILKGEGTRFIGNHVERFQPGEVYFIGRNVPHVFKCETSYYEGNNQLEASSISVFFKDETFGPQFFEIPEMSHIKRLLDLASLGVRIDGEDRKRVTEILNLIEAQDGFQRFQSLLSILDICSKSDSLQPLSSVRYTSPSKDSENERINVVFQFLSKNFREEVSLAQIASIANMTPNAFCRYFKQRTGKAFTVFLNEMRIEFAAKLIAGSHDNFGNIAQECGFNSISYFNRQFKRVMQTSPMAYRNKYR
jgi:AraC-like DNA-binding protein